MIGEQDPLTKKVTELQAVIQTQQEKIKRLAHEAEQWYHERNSLKHELQGVIQAQQDKIDQLTARLKEQTSQTANVIHLLMVVVDWEQLLLELLWVLSDLQVLLWQGI